MRTPRGVEGGGDTRDAVESELDSGWRVGIGETGGKSSPGLRGVSCGQVAFPVCALSKLFYMMSLLIFPAFLRC